MNMTGFARSIGIGLLGSALGCGMGVAQGWQHLGKVQRVERLKDGVELTSGAAKVRIAVFRDGVFRVRVAPNGTFPKDSSWAVIESPEPPAFKMEENPKEIRISFGFSSILKAGGSGDSITSPEESLGKVPFGATRTRNTPSRNNAMRTLADLNSGL